VGGAAPGGGGFLERLEPATRAELESTGAFRRYPRRAVLFVEGDPGTFVVLVLDGRAKIVATTPDGTEVVLSIRGPGDLVGELAAIDVEGAPRMASVIALEPIACRVLTTSEFVSFLEVHPDAAMALLRTVAARMRDSERRRVEFGAYDTARRLAGLLVELSGTHGRITAEGIHVEMPLSQQELAGLVGCSRESVARALIALRARGLVSTGRRSLFVRDLDGLRDFAH
jgi:CRP/FNR family transcriptional regulator, cyclic AMP receptor protein